MVKIKNVQQIHLHLLHIFKTVFIFLDQQKMAEKTYEFLLPRGRYDQMLQPVQMTLRNYRILLEMNRLQRLGIRVTQSHTPREQVNRIVDRNIRYKCKGRDNDLQTKIDSFDET